MNEIKSFHEVNFSNCAHKSIALGFFNKFFYPISFQRKHLLDNFQIKLLRIWGLIFYLVRRNRK